jgi:hypothetical protein
MWDGIVLNWILDFAQSKYKKKTCKDEEGRKYIWIFYTLVAEQLFIMHDEYKVQTRAARKKRVRIIMDRLTDSGALLKWVKKDRNGTHTFFHINTKMCNDLQKIKKSDQTQSYDKCPMEEAKKRDQQRPYRVSGVDQIRSAIDLNTNTLLLNNSKELFNGLQSSDEDYEDSKKQNPLVKTLNSSQGKNTKHKHKSLSKEIPLTLVRNKIKRRARPIVKNSPIRETLKSKPMTLRPCSLNSTAPTNTNTLTSEKSLREDAYSRLGGKSYSEAYAIVKPYIDYWISKGLPKLKGLPGGTKTYQKVIGALLKLINGTMFNGLVEYEHVKNTKLDFKDWVIAVDNWYKIVTSIKYEPVNKSKIKRINIHNFILSDKSGWSQFLVCIAGDMKKVKTTKIVPCINPKTLEFLSEMFNKPLSEVEVNSVSLFINRMEDWYKDMQFASFVDKEPKVRAKRLFESLQEGCKGNPNFCKSDNVFNESVKHFKSYGIVHEKIDKSRYAHGF